MAGSSKELLPFGLALASAAGSTRLWRDTLTWDKMLAFAFEASVNALSLEVIKLEPLVCLIQEILPAHKEVEKRKLHHMDSSLRAIQNLADC